MIYTTHQDRTNDPTFVRAARNNGVFIDPTFMHASVVRMGFHKNPCMHFIQILPLVSHFALHKSAGDKVLGLFSGSVCSGKRRRDDSDKASRRPTRPCSRKGSHASLVFVRGGARLSVCRPAFSPSPLVPTGPKGEVCCRVVLKKRSRHMLRENRQRMYLVSVRRFGSR